MSRRRGATPPEPFDALDTGRDHIQGTPPTTTKEIAMTTIQRITRENLSHDDLVSEFLGAMVDAPSWGRAKAAAFIAEYDRLQGIEASPEQLAEAWKAAFLSLAEAAAFAGQHEPVANQLGSYL